MADKIFPKGMIFKARREKAPEFVKAHISIKVDELIDFLKEHKKADGWVNLDVCKASAGNMYLSLNDFQPTKKEVTTEDSPF